MMKIVSLQIHLFSYTLALMKHKSKDKLPKKIFIVGLFFFFRNLLACLTKIQKKKKKKIKIIIKKKYILFKEKYNVNRFDAARPDDRDKLLTTSHYIAS